MLQRLSHLLFHALCIVLMLASAAHAADFTGRVVGVADGDTSTVLHHGWAERTGPAPLARASWSTTPSQRAIRAFKETWAVSTASLHFL